MPFTNAAVVAVVLSAFPLFGAQRTFVASNGTDINSCTRDLPCRSFAAAIAQTSANGEVVAIDSAGYGPFAVTQSVAVIAPLGVDAGVSVLSGDGVSVNLPVFATRALLRNLFINGQGGVNGINVIAGDVSVDHCVIGNFTNAGIYAASSAASGILVADTIFRYNGDFTTAAGAGIYISSPSILSVDHCRFDVNSNGVVADQASSISVHESVLIGGYVGLFARANTGPANMIVESTLLYHCNTMGIRVNNGDVVVHNGGVSGSSTGYAATAGFSQAARLSLDGTVISHNGTGLYVYAAGSEARITRAIITLNQTGISIGSGGLCYSRGDNYVSGNSTNVTGMIILESGT